MKRKAFTITTEKQFTRLNEIIGDFVKNETGEGLVHIFVKHTTCAIKVMEGEILLLSDVSDYLEKTWPPTVKYRHDFIAVRDVPINERINGFSHMQQMFFSASEMLPIRDGKLDLGKWQDVFLIEFDPIRERTIYMTIL